MDKSLYWNIYKGLEKELLSVADVVFINDDQLSIYSVKIAELILRTGTEIEAISKKLYSKYIDNTDKVISRKLKFDYDCLKALDERFKMRDKIVDIASPFLYTKKLKKFKPLSYDYEGVKYAWNVAYQGLKHNREAEFCKANIENFIRALGALFLLNVYLRNETPIPVNDQLNIKFDCSMGSEIFALRVYKQLGFIDSEEKKSHENPECALVLAMSSESEETMRTVQERINTEFREAVRAQLQDRAEKIGGVTEQDAVEISELLRIPFLRKHSQEVHEATRKITYELRLNK